MSIQAFPISMAANATTSEAKDLSGEFTTFSLVIPSSAAWCITSTCNVGLQGAASAAATYYDIVYANNPATSTSGIQKWLAPISAAVDGAVVICEAAQAARHVKVTLTNTATAATNFVILAHQI